MPDATARWPWLPRWLLMRWWRGTPGRFGLVALALYPALFFVPLQAMGIVAAWDVGASRLIGLGVPLLALTLLRDVGSASPEEFWLHQKGASLAEWAWLRLGGELALGAVIVTWWTLAFTVAARLNDVTMGAEAMLLLAVTLWLLYAVVGILCLGLGSTGYPRAVDLAILMLILALVTPLFDRFAQPAVALTLRALLPPLVSVHVLRDAVAADLPWRDTLRPLLHIATWCAVVLGIASWNLQRRVPAHGAGR